MIPYRSALPEQNAHPAVPAPSERSLLLVTDGELAAWSCVDAEAFGLLYDRYSARIYRMVYRRLRDRADAEDVTAEVFIKALTAIHTYQPARAPFWSWLHRIAANAVVDHVRARRSAVRAALPLDALADDGGRLAAPLLAAPPTGVEEQALHRVEAARAWQAVAELTPGQRTAVTLRLGNDLPIADIADRMDRTEGAVKLLLNRGLTAVRDRLADTAPQTVLPGWSPSIAGVDAAGRRARR